MCPVVGGVPPNYALGRSWAMGVGTSSSHAAGLSDSKVLCVLCVYAPVCICVYCLLFAARGRLAEIDPIPHNFRFLGQILRSGRRERDCLRHHPTSRLTTNKRSCVQEGGEEDKNRQGLTGAGRGVFSLVFCYPRGYEDQVRGELLFRSVGRSVGTVGREGANGTDGRAMPGHRSWTFVWGRIRNRDKLTSTCQAQ